MKDKLQYLLVLIVAFLLTLPLIIPSIPLGSPNGGNADSPPSRQVPWKGIEYGSESSYASNTTVYYEVRGDTIYMINLTTGEEKPINLFGVNWFGFETPDHVVHGLWARNWEDMLLQIKELGFNAIRLPFCTESVQPGTMPSTIDYYKNPDLQGLTSLEIMEKIVEKAGELGIFILLDYHRIGCQYIEPLWYTDSFTEQDYIDTWVSVAQIFGKYWNVIGADLKNEPHSVSPPPTAYTDGSGATWGMGDNATDWNLAAERIGSAILEVAPHWLIFVEGTQYTRPDIDGSYQWGYNAWWGGNLMAVRDYPVDLPRNKLVYSPHVYGPDVYNQPYFNEPDFPDNMPEIWYHHFGYVKIDLGYPIVIGEFGGRYGHGGDPRDVDWQNKLIDWMIENDFCSFFYWSWNPNSGDTGGILKDDWITIWEDKYANLRRLMDHCSNRQTEGMIGAYYLQDLDPEKITWHYWKTLILEPDEANDTILEAGRNSSDVLLAYLNIGYAEDWRSYWASIEGEEWVHEPTPYEGEYYIEYWRPEWHGIMKAMAEQYISAGFDGVYLDNVDAAEIIDSMNPSWAQTVNTYSEMIKLVCNISSYIKDLEPTAKVYINIGGVYSLLYNNTLIECIDGVLREELWNTLSGYNQTQPQDPGETNATLDALINAKSSGIEVLVADPVVNGEDAYNLCQASWSQGFIPIPQPAWAPNYEIPPLRGWCDTRPSDGSNNTFNLYVDFESQEVGPYTEVDLEEDFININWSRLDGRTEIAEENGNRYLRVEYPAGEAGSRNSGASFVVNLPDSEYCILEYMVRFEDGFDFSKGGKLPGLTSGGSYWTGFRVPANGEGWSARYMWRGDRTPDWKRDYNRSDASLFLYLYWMNQERSYGDYISLNYTVVPGVWYVIKQEVYVGDPGEANAYIRVYINDSLVLDMSNIQLWGEGYNAMVDSFYFSTFFGGSGSSWAPNNTVYADFDNINITCLNAQNSPQPGTPPQATISANATSIEPGDPVEVSWSISGASGWVSNIPGAGIPSVDILILSPLEDELYRVEKGVETLLGYVSITTIGGWEPWAGNVTDDMIIGYTSWGDAVVNASDPRWRDIILNEAIPYLEYRGFTGVMFDNLDQVDLYPGIKDGVTSIIAEVENAYPDLIIAVNRGFSVLGQIADHIDILLFEAYGSYYDFQDGSYKAYAGQDLEWINQTLQYVMNLSEVYGFSVLGLAYGDPEANAWEDILATVCSLNKPYGNPVYIADVYLQGIGVINPCGGENGSFIVYYNSLANAMNNAGYTVITPESTTTLYIYAWNNYSDVNVTLEIAVSATVNDTVGCSNLIAISYPEEQWPTAEIDLDGDGDNEYVIEINPWNIESADGQAVMTYCADNATLHYTQELDNIVLRNPGSWVHGYPEIFYGNKPWNQYSATDGQVPLPGRLSDLNNFYVTVSYTLNPEPGLPVNLAIESWLTRDQWRTTGVNPDEQELMIWLYYDGLQPAGSKIGEIVVPIIVNGTMVNATFEVWKAFIGWEYIAFRITTPMKTATVTIPYAPFISAAANITDLAGYTSLYLEDVEVGTEYGSPSTTSAHMEWYIYAFNLTYTDEPLITVPPPPPPEDGGDEGGATSGSLDVELVNSWGSGAQYDVDITLDNPDDWVLKVKVADGTITDSWGAKVNGSEGDYIVLVAEEWNRGPSANVGFITSGSNPLVAEVLLVVDGAILDNWTAPQPSGSDLQVELVIESEWNTGFVAKIYITNNGDTPISGWYVTIYMTSNITSIWGATYEETENDTIILRPVGYTSVIEPGETVEVGFVAEKYGDHPLPVIIDYGIEDESTGASKTPLLATAVTTLAIAGQARRVRSRSLIIHSK